MASSKIKCEDPFILLLRKGAQPHPGMGVTRIAITKDVWEEFKSRCHKEYISPSEQIHHLIWEWLGHR